jgi:hypothetical protein
MEVRRKRLSQKVRKQWPFYKDAAGKRKNSLLFRRRQIPPVEVLQILPRSLQLLVALIPGFAQLLPLFEILACGWVRKAEGFQLAVGAREPRSGFFQRLGHVRAG